MHMHFSSAMIDALLQELEERQVTLRAAPASPKNVKQLMTEVRSQHGIGKDIAVGGRKGNPTVVKQTLLSQVRAARGGRDSLKKARTVEKHSLLSQLRGDKKKLRAVNKLREAVVEEVLSERGIEDPIKITPVVAHESLPYGMKHLRHTYTTERKALLSQIRLRHLRMDNLLSSPGVPRCMKELLSAVRMFHREHKLRHTHTSCKSALFSDIRYHHNHERLITKPSRTLSEPLMNEIRDRYMMKYGRGIRGVSKESLEHQKQQLKPYCSHIKRDLLSTVRHPNVVMRTTKTKHIQLLLSDMRRAAHVTKLHRAMTNDKKALLFMIRSKKGHRNLTQVQPMVKRVLADNMWDNFNIPPKIAKESLRVVGRRLKAVRTVHKGALLSEVREVHRGYQSLAALKLSPKSRQKLLTDIRNNNGRKEGFRHVSTMDRRAFRTSIRCGHDFIVEKEVASWEYSM